MADQTNADLIAENRKWLRLHQANSYQAEAARRMIRVLDALEAADQRADLAEADLDVELDKNSGYRKKNDQLAAVVEKVRSVIERESGWYRYRAEPVSTVLASAPADVLREVKAEAIREYVAAARENPHTLYWPASGVLDDAEQWADEIEKGTI